MSYIWHNIKSHNIGKLKKQEPHGFQDTALKLVKCKNKILRTENVQVPKQTYNQHLRWNLFEIIFPIIPTPGMGCLFLYSLSLSTLFLYSLTNTLPTVGHGKCGIWKTHSLAALWWGAQVVLIEP